jgi:hypothetical protein
MPSRSARAAAAVWIAGTCLLLLLTWVAWSRADVPLRFGATPVDRVNPHYARHWRLLEHARTVIPKGARFTVTARDPDSEMLLFMLSRAALHDRHALPTSYWKIAQEAGNRARYVIAEDCPTASDAGRVLRRFEEGCVLERPGIAP